MSTETPANPRHQLDQAITRVLSRKRDPDAARKACERMDRAREEIRMNVGIVEFAVDAIRELRDK